MRLCVVCEDECVCALCEVRNFGLIEREILNNRSIIERKMKHIILYTLRVKSEIGEARKITSSASMIYVIYY